jgi:hypothetical protein
MTITRHPSPFRDRLTLLSAAHRPFAPRAVRAIEGEATRAEAGEQPAKAEA